jgi:hemoglobin
MTSLYDRLGGEGAIASVVDKFYDFILIDPKVNHFFSTTDMTKQRRLQKEFITLVFFNFIF